MAHPKSGPDRHRKKRQQNLTGHLWFGLKLSTIGFAVVAIAILSLGTGITAAQFENRDSFCASCHTQPESQYYQRNQTNQPVDLASFHADQKQVRCIDCHSGKGTTGRINAMLLGANDLLAFVTRNYKQPAPLTRPITDAHCLKCHSDISQRRDFNNHFHVFLPQWQALDPKAATCVDCHQSHTTDGQASLSFLNQENTSQVCQRCHNFAGARG
jgi:predicted CXXCH cytochrome family protein